MKFSFQTCFIHSRNSEASTIFQLIIFLTLAEDTPGSVCLSNDTLNVRLTAAPLKQYFALKMF